MDLNKNISAQGQHNRVGDKNIRYSIIILYYNYIIIIFITIIIKITIINKIH